MRSSSRGRARSRCLVARVAHLGGKFLSYHGYTEARTLRRAIGLPLKMALTVRKEKLSMVGRRERGVLRSIEAQ